MSNPYYKKCPELDKVNELFTLYWEKKEYTILFNEMLKIAETGYALAECQVGWLYYEGLGTTKDDEKAFYWTERAAIHGDRDAQCNLADMFYVTGLVVEKDLSIARKWYMKAIAQGNDYALKRCKELGIAVTDN